jgi:bifunctional DNase/RNase
MRLGKVVGITTADGDRSCRVVLDPVSQDRRLPIWIGQTEPFDLSATLAGVGFARPMIPQVAAGVLRALGGRIRQARIDRLMPAWPSDALNLVALRPAPIFVA